LSNEKESLLVEGPLIIMDSKEFSKHQDIYNSLLAQGVKIQVKKLDVGDYWIPAIEEKDLLIERKTAIDLANSVRDGRLWAQLLMMSQLTEVTPVFLLEGSPTIIRKFTKWHETSITQILWKICLKWNVKFMFSPSKYWTSISLAQLCKSLSAPKKYRIYPLRVKVKRILSDDEAARYLVEGLPNISAVLADKLLRHFKTPLKVFTASEEELTKIEGIGVKKAKEIIRILNHEYGGAKNENKNA